MVGRGKKNQQEHVECRLSDAFLEEMSRTGYDLVQRNGQRIYAPGPDVACPTPPKGCEVFISNIRDRSLFENELIPLFGSVGPLYQFRLMLDFEGFCRGYAYATYFERAHASEAVDKLHGYRIRADLRLEVRRSKDNSRLFVGDVPQTATREEAMDLFSSYVDGIIDVVMLMRKKRRLNRGYLFLEFETHQLAYKAKRILKNYKFWGKELRVEWSEPHQLQKEVPSRKPKKATLFLTNLPPDITGMDVMNYLSCYLDSGMISDIRIMSHYGFLDFFNKSLAEHALVALKGLMVAGRKVKVEWAYKSSKVLSSKALKSGQVKADEETQIKCYKPINTEGNNVLESLDFDGLEAIENITSVTFSNCVLPCLICGLLDNEEVQKYWPPTLA